MNWKYYLIILVSFGIGLYFGWHPSNDSVRQYITTVALPIGATGGGLAVVFKLWDWIEKQNIEKEKTKLDYSRKLVETVLNPLSVTEIDFDIQNTLHIGIVGLPSTSEYKRYSNEVNTCLKEYKEIQKLIRNKDELIEKHNNKSQVFFDKLTSEILSIIEPRIPIEWESSNPTDSKRYFVRKSIESALVKSIRKNYGTYESIPLTVKENRLYYDLSIYWVTSDDEKQLTEIKEMIELKFDVNIKSSDFIQLKNCYKHIKEDIHENYKKEINNIIIESVDKNKSLKGIMV